MDITTLEQGLSEELDDLLVANKILSERKTQLIMPPSGTAGMILVVKDKPRVNFKIEIYPNETEEPHFKIIYQNTTCRFKIVDCSPMKAEAKHMPTQIKKIKKEIERVWKANKEDIIKAWHDTRPTSQHHGHQIVR